MLFITISIFFLLHGTMIDHWLSSPYVVLRSPYATLCSLSQMEKVVMLSQSNRGVPPCRHIINTLQMGEVPYNTHYDIGLLMKMLFWSIFFLFHSNLPQSSEFSAILDCRDRPFSHICSSCFVLCIPYTMF